FSRPQPLPVCQDVFPSNDIAQKILCLLQCPALHVERSEDSSTQEPRASDIVFGDTVCVYAPYALLVLRERRPELVCLRHHPVSIRAHCRESLFRGFLM